MKNYEGVVVEDSVEITQISSAINLIALSIGLDAAETERVTDHFVLNGSAVLPPPVDALKKFESLITLGANGVTLASGEEVKLTEEETMTIVIRTGLVRGRIWSHSEISDGIIDPVSHRRVGAALVKTFEETALQKLAAISTANASKAEPAGESLPNQLSEEQSELVVSHMDIAKGFALKYIANYNFDGATFNDYYSEGLKGLVNAALSFDPAKNVPFKSFAKHRVEGAIKDYVRRIAPGSRAQYALRTRANKERDELTHLLGRLPSEGEVAAALGVSEAKLNDAELTKFKVYISDLSEDDPYDYLDVDIGEEFLEADTNRAIELALPNLNPDQSFVLETILQGHPYDWIAAQIGVSESRISQIYRIELVPRIRKSLIILNLEGEINRLIDPRVLYKILPPHDRRFRGDLKGHKQLASLRYIARELNKRDGGYDLLVTIVDKFYGGNKLPKVDSTELTKQFLRLAARWDEAVTAESRK